MADETKREEIKAVRLTRAELEKVIRLSPLTGKTGDFSATVRMLIRAFPEPEQLAQAAFSNALIVPGNDKRSV